MVTLDEAIEAIISYIEQGPPADDDGMLGVGFLLGEIGKHWGHYLMHQPCDTIITLLDRATARLKDGA